MGNTITIKQLIGVREQNGTQVVSAKELHEFVEMTTRFDVWIKRMLEYGFVEGVDYEQLIKKLQLPNNGNRDIIDDYALTLNCAKEISMIQRNEKGKIARKYFLDCEKQLKTQLNTIEKKLPVTYIQALEQLLTSEKEKEKLMLENKTQNQEIQILTPKGQFYDAVTISDDYKDMSEVAKILGFSGRNILFEFLRYRKVLRPNNQPYQPYQPYVDAKYMKVVEENYIINGKTKIGTKTVVSQKGIDKIRKKWLEIGQEFLDNRKINDFDKIAF
ncbi:MAG: antA/AntB antirepressor family protein [Candidatus Omnitrophota bacterium]